MLDSVAAGPFEARDVARPARPPQPILGAEWSALFFGHTPRLGYHLTCVPEGFGEADRRWIKQSIKGALQAQESLIERRSPRWVVACNDRYRVFGLACASSLLSDRCAYDGVRALCVFAAFVARSGPTGDWGDLGPPSMPGLVPLQEDWRGLFGGLYRAYCDGWADDNDEPDQMVYAQNPEIDRFIGLSDLGSHNAPILNADPALARLAPIASSGPYWESAILAEGRVSLCLGFETTRDAHASGFLNATSADVRVERTIQRAIGRPPDASTLAPEMYLPTRADLKRKKARKDSKEKPKP